MNENNNQNQNNNQNNNNQSQSEKIYLGNAKQIPRKSGDSFLGGTICIDDILLDECKPYTFESKAGKRFLKIVINPYRDGANQYGNTHSISVDTFRPDPNYRNNQGNQSNQGNQGNQSNQGNQNNQGYQNNRNTDSESPF